jgi:hypothetical protein
MSPSKIKWLRIFEKKITMTRCFTIILTLVSFNINAQTSDIQIFSENLEPFHLMINGQKVSSTPAEAQSVSGLAHNKTYEVIIDYIMPDTPDIKTSLQINNDAKPGVLTYMVPKFFQGSLINSTSEMNNFSNEGNMSINMNVSQDGFNISMNTNENSSQNNQSHVSNINSDINTEETVIYVPGYNGDVGCSHPVKEDRFEDMMQSVEDASFAQDKVRVCKRILKTNCLIIDNLILMLEEISFDEDQLELAKFAYDHIYDLENYYKVYDVFSFSKSGEELEEYIENR